MKLEMKFKIRKILHKLLWNKSFRITFFMFLFFCISIETSYSAEVEKIITSQTDFNLGSQQINSIKGKVTDLTGASLPGVSVVVKGTTTGVITDSDGNYSLLNIPTKATLVFSFVGMTSQEVEIGEKTIINVKLKDETTNLEEVVAIGYGTAKKKDLTGAVTSVKSKNMQN